MKLNWARKQIGGRAFVAFEHVLHGVERRLHGLAHHRNEQVLLVLEIDVDRALGDAGALGDLIERGRRVAVARKLDERGFDDFLRAFGLAPAPGFGARIHQVSHVMT